MFIKCSDDATSSTITKYTSALQTLAYCSTIDVNTDAPTGCTILTISDKCEVHLLLKGLIEPTKEIAKMQKQLEFLEGTKNKLNQTMSAADYATKVPAEFQQANTEKLSQTTVEIERINNAIASLKLME